MKLPPASYSFINDFANCAKKAFHRYVARDAVKVETPELKRGRDVHKAFEYRLTGDPRHLHGWTAAMEAMAAPLARLNARAEVQLACDALLKPAPYFEDPWLRGRADALVARDDSALLIDWKTGKVREDPRELFVQAILVKANYPEIRRITGAYGWLVEGRIGEVYDLSNTDRALAGTRATLAEAQTCAEQNNWPMQPNPLCSYCDAPACPHLKRKP